MIGIFGLDLFKIHIAQEERLFPVMDKKYPGLPIRSNFYNFADSLQASSEVELYPQN